MLFRSRIVGFSSLVPGESSLDPNRTRQQLGDRFYFDLAGFVFEGDDGGLGQLKALVSGYNISYDRLLYGSDFPFTKTNFVKDFAERMKGGLENLFEEEERQAIYEGNAQKLLRK